MCVAFNWFPSWGYQCYLFSFCDFVLDAAELECETSTQCPPHFICNGANNQCMLEDVRMRQGVVYSRTTGCVTAVVESAADANGHLAVGLADYRWRWGADKVVRLEWGQDEFIQFSTAKNPLVNRRVPPTTGSATDAEGT